MEELSHVNWNKVKVVIFDVDGTLYDQQKLRRKMLQSLLLYYAFKPWRIKELKLLQTFRAEREKRPGHICENLQEAQYDWCLEKVRHNKEDLIRLVNHWMFDFPSRYLSDCVYPGTADLFAVLRSRGCKVAIYSDYEAQQKLKVMNLSTDFVLSSTDKQISRLKPQPKGLEYIAAKFGVGTDECLFIGDRPELDGKCAENANMPYLIIEKKPLKSFDYFNKLITDFLIPL